MDRVARYVICKCEELVPIEGDYPKYYAYCDDCHEYVDGFDPMAHAAEVMADTIDQAEYELDPYR